MSLNRTLIIWFDTDDDNRTSRGFFGTYEFISNEQYNMGVRDSPGTCGWTMNADAKMEGYIMAPHYPAVYPDNLNCYYKLKGQPGQRIKLEFIDFDIYYGGDHCPYDNLRIHDGSSRDDPEIGNYCNRMPGLVIYSTRHHLFMQFETRSGRPKLEYEWGDNVIKMSGFKAKYTFSSSFVHLGFIGDGKHIRGSECDVRVKSEKESQGVIVSPDYPLTSPSNVTCFYYIDGLIDRENLEKVILTFDEANLPIGKSERCSQGNVFISTYIYGQIATTDRPDRHICNSNLPATLVSKDPRLTLKYTTRNIQPGSIIRFKATFRFIIDYAIEGTPASILSDSECHFIYRSSSVKQGKLNSPRYPTEYPNNIACTYELIAEKNEFIMISFDTFNVATTKCKGDSISAKSVIPRPNNKTLHIKMGEYCGTAYPGPLVSEWLTERMILTFKSDSQVTKRGFQAKYEFIHSAQRFRKSCGGNITVGGSGVIVPPNYPLKYQTRTVCDWYIYRRNPLAQIKIKFEHFDIEGTMEEGCQGAVLRIYKADEHNIDFETCGQEAPVDNVISENGFIRIKFITSSKSFGKTGFKITWSEVMLDVENCKWFQCADMQVCVPDTAICNGRNDCIDGSDEVSCARKLSNMNILYIIMGAVIFVLIIVLAIICLCIRCSVNKVQSRRSSMRLSMSKYSEGDMTIYPEITTSDTKMPMLPLSDSNNAMFISYDHQTRTRYNGDLLLGQSGKQLQNGTRDLSKRSSQYRTEKEERNDDGAGSCLTSL
ncbi:zinc metalloproteinase nas-39-like [Watersipora subatra]|uniref:zinc metalloproteinase nas-39-like n=1 Tax=Watersipora subatra TaxID=2589382 RepID=UPI00355C8804